MSGSCKHQKRCGLLLLRLLHIFLNKIYKKKKKKKKKKNTEPLFKLYYKLNVKDLYYLIILKFY